MSVALDGSVQTAQLGLVYWKASNGEDWLIGEVVYKEGRPIKELMTAQALKQLESMPQRVATYPAVTRDENNTGLAR